MSANDPSSSPTLDAFAYESGLLDGEDNASAGVGGVGGVGGAPLSPQSYFSGRSGALGSLSGQKAKIARPTFDSPSPSMSSAFVPDSRAAAELSSPIPAPARRTTSFTPQTPSRPQQNPFDDDTDAMANGNGNGNATHSRRQSFRELLSARLSGGDGNSGRTIMFEDVARSSEQAHTPLPTVVLPPLTLTRPVLRQKTYRTTQHARAHSDYAPSSVSAAADAQFNTEQRGDTRYITSPHVSFVHRFIHFYPTTTQQHVVRRVIERFISTVSPAPIFHNHSSGNTNVNTPFQVAPVTVMMIQAMTTAVDAAPLYDQSRESLTDDDPNDDLIDSFASEHPASSGGVSSGMDPRDWRLLFTVLSRNIVDPILHTQFVEVKPQTMQTSQHT